MREGRWLRMRYRLRRRVSKEMWIRSKRWTRRRKINEVWLRGDDVQR